MSDVRIQIPLTTRQRAMLENPAKILWVGTGTKTGKTTALGTWLAQGLLTHQSCAWVGPWFQRTRTGFEVIKSLLAPLISSGQVKATEGVLKISEVGNSGAIEFYSADNFAALFGGGFHRVVLDEASRQPEGIFAAALTTISATNGRLKCAFNLELGSRNWAIKNLLRTQAMSPKQRLAAGEDFLTFPSGGDGLVDPALIEKMRAAMPGPLWRALYFAEIPESDLSLFRNLDQVFSGEELSEPAEGRSYVAGIDLGRKQDWTVVTVIDESGDVVATDRYHQISWALQAERAAELCTKFKCSKVFCDATGVGDSVIETLEALGLEVEPVIFTQKSRKELLETLILACDKVQITLPTTEKFAVYRREMETFEYQLDGSTIRYAAPPGLHDDAVFSLALCVHGFKALDYGEWPLVIAMKRVGAKLGLYHGPIPASFEDSQKKPGWNKQPEATQPVRVARPAPPFGPQLEPCTNCGSSCVVRLSGMTHCNMCGHDLYPDGAVHAPASGSSRCECKVPQIQELSGFKRCTICGWQSTDSRFAVNGMSRRDYFAQGFGRRRGF